MIINNHILKLSNIFYYKNKFLINENIMNDENYKNVNFDKFIDDYTFINDSDISNIPEKLPIDNLFVVDTLDSCFCHALIDRTFPYFWAKNDIQKYHDDSSKELICFIRKKLLLQYQVNINNVQNNQYKGAWNDLIHIISDKIIFEHLLNKDVVIHIKDCFFYIKDDLYQRSPWNCVDYYPPRNIEKNKIIYNDTIISYELYNFTNYVKTKLNVEHIDDNKNIIIINRKGQNRNINQLIPLFNKFFEKFSNYKGVVYLEDLTFKQQIEVFTKNKIIISPHGANLIHSIWNKNNTIIEITFNNPNQNKMYKRICDITNNNIIQIDYMNIMYLFKNFMNIYNNI